MRVDLSNLFILAINKHAPIQIHTHTHTRTHTHTPIHTHTYIQTQTCTLSRIFHADTQIRKEVLMTLLQVIKHMTYFYFLLQFSLLIFLFHSCLSSTYLQSICTSTILHYYITTITHLITFFITFLITLLAMSC